MEPSFAKGEASSSLALDAVTALAAENATTPLAILWTQDERSVEVKSAFGCTHDQAAAIVHGGIAAYSALEIPFPFENGITGAICVLDPNRLRMYDDGQLRALGSLARAASAVLAEETFGSSNYAILKEAAAFAELGVSVYSIADGETHPVCEYLNESARARTGYSHGAFRNELEAFFAVQENRLCLEQMLHRAQRDDHAPFEAELVARDDERHWVEISVRRLPSTHPGRLRFMAIARDVTRRRQAERERSLLAAAIEEHASGVLIARLHRGHWLRPAIVYANTGFARLTGYASEEIAAGVYPVILGAQTDRDVVRDAAARVVNGEAVIVEAQLYRRDGSAFWAEVRAHALESPAEHVVLIINDVSARRAQDDWMRMLTEAVDQASDFIILTDDTKHDAGGPRIRYFNRSFREATGYDDADLIGKPYTTFYSPRNDANLMTAIRDAIEAGRANYRELLAIRKDGSEFWIEFVGKPIINNDGRIMRMSIGRDITLRRRAASQLALMFSAMEQSPSRIILYEPDEHGHLSVAYENEAASLHGAYRLKSIWSSADKTSRGVREKLRAGERVERVYAEHDATGVPSIVDFTANSVRNGARLEAIITTERVLASADAESADTHLLTLATLLLSVREARTAAEHLHVIRALLLDAFGAHVSAMPRDRGSAGVSIDADERRATFNLGTTAYEAQWDAPLADAELTALRFCIEACIEHAERVREPSDPER